MGRQFRFYILPSDAEALISELRLHSGLKLIQETSPTFTPIEVASPVQNAPRFFGVFGLRDASSVRCYLASANSAEIKMLYYPTRSEWLVQEESEVIEFSGCEYDGDGLLQIGRMYFQSDVLIGDTVWRKRKEFTDWASKIFRTAKKSMRYSESLQAYVGREADNWQKNGGRFIALFRSDGAPVDANY
ncbi:MAG TPA: hypothetical protein VFW25_06725 [Silvibacterium sp.]|nr:hypothetical protein [Silvibacterium sp.]